MALYKVAVGLFLSSLYLTTSLDFSHLLLVVRCTINGLYAPKVYVWNTYVDSRYVVQTYKLFYFASITTLVKTTYPPTYPSSNLCENHCCDRTISGASIQLFWLCANLFPTACATATGKSFQQPVPPSHFHKWGKVILKVWCSIRGNDNKTMNNCWTLCNI